MIGNVVKNTSLPQENEFNKKIMEPKNKNELLTNEYKHPHKDIQRFEKMNKQLENANEHLDNALKNEKK